MTLAAREIVSLGGTLNSFAEASEKTLVKLCGLRLSESTVQRTTKAAGREVAAWLPQTPCEARPGRPWLWQRDAEGKRCGYVSVDHTGIRRQGPGGAKLEGRMAAVGMIYNATSEHDPVQPPPHQTRYLAGFYPLEELGQRLFAQAVEVAGPAIERWIGLTDGGNGLEELLQRNFPLDACILDFWHASEYVAALARAVHPNDQEAFDKLHHQWCHQMKHEGGAALLATLEDWQIDESPQALREAHEEVTRYIRNHVHRMDYPTYVARGWQIGSGPVEAACKTVIGQRLKESGMRWGDDGADAVSHLRALYLSESTQWDRFWARPLNQSPQN